MVKNGKQVAKAAATEVQIASVAESSSGIIQFSDLRQYQPSMGKVASVECKFTQVYNVEKGLTKDYELVRLEDGELWVREVSSTGSIFNHLPTSGVVITNTAKQGTFLLGSYPSDLQYILAELNYPKI